MNTQYIKKTGTTLLLFNVMLVIALLPLATVNAAEQGTPDRGQAATSTTREYEALGQDFADAVNKQDVARLADVFDLKDFAYRTGRIIFTSESDVKNFVKGVLENSKQKFLARIFADAFRGNAKAVYLRILKSDRPLVRIDFQNGGHQYLILHLKEQNNGKYEFDDMFRMTTGKDLSASIAEAVQVMQKPSHSFIMRMFGRHDVDPKIMASFKKIAILKNAGKYKEAYDILESFPDAIKKRRTMIDTAITLSQHISNVEYRKQLGMLDKYYGDNDSTVFTLIDYYFFNHEYNKIQAGLDRVIARLGEDGALDELKADAYVKAKDFKNARKYCERAIKVEPNYEGGYWALVTVLNAKQDYGRMIKALGMIEKQFGYSFTAKSFEHKRFYKKFVQSPEFKAKYL